MLKRIILLALIASVTAGGCSNESTPTDPLPGTPADTASLASLYDELPNVAGCFEGRLKAAEKTKVLDYVNAIRRLHGLEAVTYSASDDINTAKAALIIVANATLTHTPTPSMTCYTAEGLTGSGTSNLAMRSGQTPSSAVYIDQFLIDNGVVSLGHRRWIIDPFLSAISFGRVDRTVGGALNGAALRVIFDQQKDIRNTSIELVAYPYHDYPARLLPTNGVLSLTVIHDRTSRSSNGGVDYSGAAVTVTSETGATITTENLGSDDDGYGVPNVFRFRAPGITTGIRYNVVVRNVVVDGAAREFSWWFKLVS
jgi:uncharacterized protein YkwD